MGGEEDLGILLRSMDPELRDADYVFCTMARGAQGLIDLDPWAMIQEKEGTTMILEKVVAERSGIPFQSVYRCITLNIHSSLDAVGLTAAVSSKLAKAGISANVVAAFYHDHVFVQKDRADEAVLLLRELMEKS